MSGVLAPPDETFHGDDRIGLSLELAFAGWAHVSPQLSAGLGASLFLPLPIKDFAQ